MLNEARLIGRLGKDPELEEMGGKPFVRLRLATTYRGARTTWHDVVVWGPRAKGCAEYLSKGRLVYVAGRMQTRTWKDEAGVKHYRREVVASNVLFLDRPSDAASTGTEDREPTDEELGIPAEYAELLEAGDEEDELPF